MKEIPINIISLGAGVQSSTMALMAACGELEPMPQYAIFADVGNETNDVYAWLDKLQSLLPFPVEITRNESLKGSLYDNIFENDHSQIPAFFINEKDGSIGIGKRQCTAHWKIRPIQKRIRQISGTERKRLQAGYFQLWQGISTDEVSRAKDNRAKWIKNEFPLLDKRMSRRACKQWLIDNGHGNVPKSACFFCPYRSNAQWSKSKENPKEWEKIVELDRKLNARGEYLHSSCQPIDQIKFTDDEKGQLNLWNNECEGMCGV